MPPLSNDKPCDDPENQRLRCGLPDDSQKMLQPIQAYPAQWPPGGQGKKCECKKHPRGGGNSTAGMKYIQPPVPTSYKPDKRYMPSNYKMESGTIYRLSYPTVDAETMQMSRPGNIKGPRDNFQPSSMPISQDTTFRLSYTGVPGERAVSFKPNMRYSMMGKGPMQSVTTNRHDYTPKEIFERLQTSPAPNNIHLSNAKMEENTTMRLSYQPVEGEKVQSYKPVGVYKKSDYKFEQDTVNRLSYQPWVPLPKEEFPWQKPASYQQPVYSMENNTIYRASYLPNTSIERTISYKPQASFAQNDKKFAEETIYRESYQNSFDAYSPVERVVRTSNIQPSTLPMSQDTTFRLSYTGVPGEKAVPLKPFARSMMGAGPMQSVTTQRHDFTPKPLQPTENFRPKPAMLSSEYKMEDTTTFRASYLPNEPLPRAVSFKPVSVYRQSSYSMESDTINRLSYQPWVAGPKEEYPWMKRAQYQQPTYTMDGTSIYRGSYIAPGNYIPDENAPPGGGEICTCNVPPACNATDDL